MMTPVVETRYGRIAGREVGGVHSFLGIPYAQAPLGDLRFRAPRPPLPWRRVRPAVELGPPAPQDPRALALLPQGCRQADESCLRLNVWTTGLDRPRRPVLVRVHGGEFSSGTSSSPFCDGGVLSRLGDMVVVTFNHRLGALGYLAHPELRCPETGAAGNWAILDALAVLEWVADHAAAFGGDPMSVTLWGESAGAGIVAALMATPAAQGLFQRAIVQGGHPLVMPLEIATRAAEILAKELGLDTFDLDRLRGVPAEAIVQAQSRCAPALPGALHVPFGPVVDGGLLAREPEREVEGGASGGIALLIGGHRDEWSSFVLDDPRRSALDEATLLRRLERVLPGEHECGTPHALRAVETYRRSRSAAGLPTSPWEIWCAIQTDRLVWLPALRFAEHHARHEPATYAYRFPGRSRRMGCSATLHGVAEGLTQGRPAGELERAVRRVLRAWIAFVAAGHPGHDELPRWAPFERKGRRALVFGRECRLEPVPAEEEHAFWLDLL
jgi:para-nitrobenzyl esterase